MRAFDIVVIADAERGIARDGGLPWHLPADLRHFKATTTKTRSPGLRNAVIMGRATWESLPPRWRPLAERFNIVLSRQPTLVLPEGVAHCGGLPEALAMLGAPPHDTAVESVFVVGGGEIYAQAIELDACRRIYYTRIAATYGCDTFFPPFEDGRGFSLERVLSEHEEGGVPYRIELWSR